MKHISQDELVLHYYGESGDEVKRHLDDCADCRASFEQLAQMLAAIKLPEPPARSDEYGGEVWRRIRNRLPEPQVATRRWAAAFSSRKGWAAAAALAVLIVAAFLAGRYTRRPASAPIEATNNAQLPQRVLVVALGDYLDRSEMLLVEVAHANRPEDLDLETQRRYASELIGANRLYRQTAQRVGDTSTDALLEQLERVLLQVAHTPQGATNADLQQLRHEIESGGLLFKVRVAQVNLKSEAKSSGATRPQDQRPTI